MNDIHHTDIDHTGHWSHHVKNRTLTTPDNDHTRHPPTTLDIHLIRYWPHQTFTTRHSPGLFWCGGCLVWWMSGAVNVLFLHTVWWLSGIVNVWCGGCLVWSMSYLTHGVVIVQCGQCLCGQCRTIRLGGHPHPSLTVSICENFDPFFSFFKW